MGNEGAVQNRKSFSTTGDGSDNPFTTIQREDVGLQLTVTPHVHDGETVRLEVSQEITNIVPEAPIGSAGFSDVGDLQAHHRDRRARRRPSDHHSRRSDPGRHHHQRRQGSPSSGSIPALGWLFRSESKSNTRRNLLIFLRPTVIRDAAGADLATQRKYDEIWEVGQSSFPVQGNRRASRPTSSTGATDPAHQGAMRGLKALGYRISRKIMGWLVRAPARRC